MKLRIDQIQRVSQPFMDVGLERVWAGLRTSWRALLLACLFCVGSPALLAAVSNNETSYWRGRTLLELREGADKGNAVAQRLLGNLYLNGDSVPTNSVEAAKWFKLSADQGDALAQLALGMMCAEGDGMPRNKTEAAKWYRKAGEQGVTEAQVNLATCYSRGEGVPQDDGEAARWFKKAAEAGDRLGQLNFGFALLDGRGVPRNASEAVRWLRPAAYQGSIDAAFRLGIMYMQGEGVAKDPETSRVWFTRAAENGHRDANYEMAYHYLTGPIENRSKGISFLQRGAELGHARSEYLLGLLTLKGDFVSQDRAAAQVLLSKAAQHGETNAAAILSPKNRDRLDEVVRVDLQTLLGSPSAPTAQIQHTEPAPVASAPPPAARLATNAPAPSVVVVTNTLFVTNNVPPEKVFVQGANPAPIKLIIAICVAVSLVCICVIAIMIFSVFQKRMTNLERELSQTREQVTLANKNFASFLRQVEAHMISGTPLDVSLVIEAKEIRQLAVTESQSTMFRAKRGRAEKGADVATGRQTATT